MPGGGPEGIPPQLEHHIRDGAGDQPPADPVCKPGQDAQAQERPSDEQDRSA